MSVALVSVASAAWDDNTISKGVSLDATGCNLVVGGVVWRNTAPNSISTVSYGAGSLGRIGSVFSSASPRMDMDYWQLVSPASGSNTMTFNTTGGAIGGGGNDGVIWAMGFSGANTSSPIGDDQHFEAVTPFQSLGITLSAATDDLCIDIVIINGIAVLTLTTGAGQTAQTAVSSGSTAYSNSSRKAGAASVSMTWDYTPSLTFNAAQRGIVIQAAAAGGTHAGPLVDGALIKNLVNGAIIA